MLLVKCSQCGASYKLSDDLYRRKAAGFGVVVTCRRCKNEIHVDAESPQEVAENDAAPTAPTHERPEPPHASDEDTPPPRTPEPAATKTPEPVMAKVAPRLSTRTPGLTSKPSPPKTPVARPLPAAATVKGIGVEAVRAAGLRRVEEKTGTSPASPPARPVAKPTPRLVALSPGLLGTVTAPKPKAAPSPPSPGAVSPSPPATSSPNPPAAAMPPVAPGQPKAPAAPAKAKDPEEAAWDPSVPPPPPAPESAAADSEVAVASRDFLPADSAPISELSLDSRDYVSEPPSAPAEHQEPEAPKRRMPEPPPAKRGAKIEREQEVPSTTGTPKLDTLIHGTALPLEQKKGEPPRKRLRSGDLSDEFMNSELAFEAPALAPPTADALLRAPESSRPAAAATPSRPASKATTGPSKSARSAAVKAETKSSGRGWVAIFLLAALAGGGFAFRDRLGSPKTPPEPERPAATPAESEPPPSPVAEAPPPVTEPAPPAVSASAEGSVGTAPTDTATVARGDGAIASPGPATTARAAGTSTPAPARTSTAASPSPATTASPTAEPTSDKPSEPRPSVGTEPFDTAAARAALDASAAQASSCRKPGDPSGVAVVTITFSPTGRVTSATINGPPFAATPTGGCIASTLRKTRVPAFAGDMVTVRKTVTIN
jgi:hypothetical protein